MEHKVLIVDDSVMMRSVIRTFVTKMPDFRAVAFAENGKKALEELSNHKDLSLILLDIESKQESKHKTKGCSSQKAKIQSKEKPSSNKISA